jgi:arylformamidase
MSKWRDITMPSFDGMVNWPGDGRVEMKLVMSIEEGAECNVTRLNMSVHTGTHMDAPGHFIADGVKMEAWPVEATVGRCRVIEILDPEAVRAAELARHGPQPGERILFKTENSRRQRLASPVFVEEFTYVAEDAAQLLVNCGVQTVGVDYLSVGGFFKDGRETHLALLGAGVWVIEGLDLTAISPGEYELNCLPLLLRGADGAPCRALLRELEMGR